VTLSRFGLWLLAILLLAAGGISLLVLLGALSGHPMTTAIGAALLPVSFFGGLLLVGCSIAALRAGLRTKKAP
jgi:hypothetical protein